MGNTGFYVTLNNTGPYNATGFRFTTAKGNEFEKRDPLKVSIEGSNMASGDELTKGSSWRLIYQGTSGLDTDPGRGMPGQLITFNDNTAFYSSYRLLIQEKRAAVESVAFSEFVLFGTPAELLQLTAQCGSTTTGKEFSFGFEAAKQGRGKEVTKLSTWYEGSKMMGIEVQFDDDRTEIVGKKVGSRQISFNLKQGDQIVTSVLSKTTPGFAGPIELNTSFGQEFPTHQRANTENTTTKYSPADMKQGKLVGIYGTQSDEGVHSLGLILSNEEGIRRKLEEEERKRKEEEATARQAKLTRDFAARKQIQEKEAANKLAEEALRKAKEDEVRKKIEILEMKAKQEAAEKSAQRIYMTPLCGNVSGGSYFEYGLKEAREGKPRHVRTLTVWHEWGRIRGIQIKYDDETAEHAGTMEGNMKKNEHTFKKEERIRWTILSKYNYGAGRAGPLQFHTNMGKQFNSYERKHEYLTYAQQDLTQGVLIGIYGRQGADVDCLGLILLKPGDKEYVYVNMHYHLSDAWQADLELVSLKDGMAENISSSAEITQEVEHTEKVDNTQNWSVEAGLMVGVETSIKAGFPGVAEAGTTFKAEVSVKGTYGKTSTESKENKWKASVKINPKGKVKWRATMSRGTIVVPFTADINIRKDDGSTELLERRQGVYQGVQASNFKLYVWDAESREPTMN